MIAYTNKLYLKAIHQNYKMKQHRRADIECLLSDEPVHLRHSLQIKLKNTQKDKTTGTKTIYMRNRNENITYASLSCDFG